MRALLSALAILNIALFPNAADAQARGYPEKPVRFICPFPPGGGVDIVTRILSAKLSEMWGQPVIVDNRAGAGGTVGAGAAAKASPDGYTLLMGGAGAIAISPALYKEIPYDAIKDLTPISLIGTTPMVLVVHPSVPAKSEKEFIAYAKANPGKVSYASAGVGSILHLTMEMLRSMTGMELVHVPYKGIAPALTDLTSGRVVAMVGDLPFLRPHIEVGKIRALGLTTATRSSQLPAVPTIAESGVPGFEAVFWHAVFTPAGVPAAIVAKLNADITQALTTPELRKRLADNGVTAVGSTHEQLIAFVKSETNRWRKAVKDSGATAE